jgi:hypothetical protein
MDRNEFDSGAEAVMCGPNCVLISDPDEYVTVIHAVWYSASCSLWRPFEMLPYMELWCQILQNSWLSVHPMQVMFQVKVKGFHWT